MMPSSAREENSCVVGTELHRIVVAVVCNEPTTTVNGTTVHHKPVTFFMSITRIRGDEI